MKALLLEKAVNLKRTDFHSGEANMSYTLSTRLGSYESDEKREIRRDEDTIKNTRKTLFPLRNLEILR